MTTQKEDTKPKLTAEQQAAKYLREHGYPENHKLPQSIEVERNGVKLSYNFTERDRLLAKGKGLPYWMPDMATPLNKLVEHMGEDIVTDAIRQYYTVLMQELTNPERDSELWSEDKTRIDDERLVKAISEHTIQKESIKDLTEEWKKITDEDLPKALAGLASDDPQKVASAKEAQAKIMSRLPELAIKIANLKAKRGSK